MGLIGVAHVLSALVLQEIEGCLLVDGDEGTTAGGGIFQRDEILPLGIEVTQHPVQCVFTDEFFAQCRVTIQRLRQLFRVILQGKEVDSVGVTLHHLLHGAHHRTLRTADGKGGDVGIATHHLLNFGGRLGDQCPLGLIHTDAVDRLFIEVNLILTVLEHIHGLCTAVEGTTDIGKSGVPSGKLYPLMGEVALTTEHTLKTVIPLVAVVGFLHLFLLWTIGHPMNGNLPFDGVRLQQERLTLFHRFSGASAIV